MEIIPSNHPKSYFSSLHLLRMAISMCFSSTHSLPFTNIPATSFPTKSATSFKFANHAIAIPPAYFPSSIHTTTTVSTIEQLALAEAASLLERILEGGGNGASVDRELDVAVRRKRRRKRRMGGGSAAEEVDGGSFGFVGKKGGERAGFMSSKDEAKFSWFLKERARIEAVRIGLESENGGQKLSSSQWAKAAGTSTGNLDRILCNARESEERISSSYQRLVASVATSYQGKGLSLQDLAQEGVMGLIRGATKFNPDRGYKLSTYSYWWIRQAISRAVANKSRIIRLPGRLSELVPKICKANTVLTRRLRRIPTYDEIAKAVEAETSVVRLAFEKNRTPISLDQAMTNQGCMSLQAIIPGPDEMNPEAMLRKEGLKPEIRKLLETLSDREAHILTLHYGLNGETPLSFEEVGRRFNLSRERVRQINSNALSKLGKMKGIGDLKYFL